MGENIKDLNWHFLMVLRDYALRDLAAACQSFGVPREVGLKVRDLPLEDLKRLAECDQPYIKGALTTAVFERIETLPTNLRSAFMVISGGHK